jgi:hypothetical protein
VNGMFRSTNKGVSWTRVNDDAHQFGGTNLIFGDLNVFGRVYMSGTLGRGLIYWDLVSPNAIESKSVVNNMVIYPNPARDGRFSIMLPGASHNISVSIFDSQGRLLSEKIFNNSDRMDIDSGLKKGIYLVKATSEGMNFTQKLIVK